VNPTIRFVTLAFRTTRVKEKQNGSQTAEVLVAQCRMHLDHMDYNIGNIDNFKHLYRSILNKLTLSCSSSSLEKTSNRTKSEFAIPSLSSVHLIHQHLCKAKSIICEKSSELHKMRTCA
jgi:hypothetical protein